MYTHVHHTTVHSSSAPVSSASLTIPAAIQLSSTASLLSICLSLCLLVVSCEVC